MAIPLSNAQGFGSKMSQVSNTGLNIKTPIAPTIGLNVKTPIAPNLGATLKTPTMSNIGFNTKTPVAPNLGAKNVTPVSNRQFGSVNKSEMPQLFHGSPNAIKPGSTIKPGMEGSAWASTKVQDAENYANQKMPSSTGKKTWQQQTLFNPVYSVKPVDIKDVQQSGWSPNYRSSKSGFKVEGVHSWTSPNEVNPAAQAKAKALKASRKSGI